MQERRILSVALDHIHSNPNYPQWACSEQSIADLAQSIRIHGLLRPLLVRKIDAQNYEIIAGEQCLRALRLLGELSAAVVVLPAQDAKSLLYALLESRQQEHPHYMEEAHICRMLIDRYGISKERLAHMLGEPLSALSKRLKLLRLPKEIRASNLTERHALALLKLSDENLCRRAMQTAIDRHYTVQQLEHYIAELRHQTPIAIRDERLVLNALTDTVHRLQEIGIPIQYAVTQNPNSIDICVSVQKRTVPS